MIGISVIANKCFMVEIGELSTLESLVLSYNRINEIPDAVSRLKNLQTLWLCSNRITTLPKGLGHLPKLDWNRRMMTAALDDNPLVHPPVSIAKQGAAAIEKYLGLHHAK